MLALLPGSPLIDAGQGACPTVDQRGVTRTDVFELSGATGEPLGPGGIVSLTYSGDGAGLALGAPTTATTDASGVVTLTSFANLVTGTHVVTASVRGAIGTTVVRLVNVAPMLSIHLAGNASGVVNGSAAGIACSAACSTEFGYGDVVSLTAAPAADARFTGWTGDCSGSGICSVTMTRTHHVTTTFAANRDDAFLSALTLNPGTLTPAFVSLTMAYAWTADGRWSIVSGQSYDPIAGLVGSFHQS